VKLYAVSIQFLRRNRVRHVYTGPVAATDEDAAIEGARRDAEREGYAEFFGDRYQRLYVVVPVPPLMLRLAGYVRAERVPPSAN
jgi:hypothetical protein